MRSSYPLAANTFGPEEIQAAKAVLDSQNFTMGDRVLSFELAFAEWLGVRHALMVNSGSSANLLMVEAMLRRSSGTSPWKVGDEVLVPALAWPTTVWPLAQLGLTPVFVDVDPQTLAIDLESAATALSPKTKGLFLIHVLGQVPDMHRYQAFCKEHGLTLLEDNCESLGAHFEGRAAGTFGVTGSFSCYFSHHISTIEGGLIVTSDTDLFNDLKSFRAHGWVRDRSDKAEWKNRYSSIDDRFLFVTTGYNVRPMEIQGAIGLVQLAKLDRMLEAREKLAQQVHKALKKSAPWLKLIGAERLDTEKLSSRRERKHSWMTFPLKLEKNSPLSLDAVKKRLEDFGVETRPVIAGNLARHPACNQIKTRSASSLKNCDDLLSQGFMIGCHPFASPAAIETLHQALASLAKV